MAASECDQLRASMDNAREETTEQAKEIAGLLREAAMFEDGWTKEREQSHARIQAAVAAERERLLAGSSKAGIQ